MWPLFEESDPQFKESWDSVDEFQINKYDWWANFLELSDWQPGGKDESYHYLALFKILNSAFQGQ